MGTEAPKVFHRAEDLVIVSGMLEFDVGASEEEIRSEITELICTSEMSGLDLSDCEPADIEFVKCSGKVCRIPETTTSFTWNGSAIKHLCGQGDLYVRLCKDVSSIKKVRVKEEPSTTGDSVIFVEERQGSHSKSHTPESVYQRSLHRGSSPSGSCSSSSRPSSSSLQPCCSSDLVSKDVPHPSTESDRSSSPEPNLPSILGGKSPSVITRESLYDIFSSLPRRAIDIVCDMCSGDTARALNELLDPAPPKLLQLHFTSIQNFVHLIQSVLSTETSLALILVV